VHRWTLCIGGRGTGAGPLCWLVPESNEHQGADGHCRVDDRGEIHAVAELYPMTRIRSRSAKKLTENAPTPMAATALTAQQ
jgi:hypothetical protein